MSNNNNNKTIFQTFATIIEHCPECNPRDHFANSPFTSTGRTDEVSEETLYACDDCDARVWVPEL